MKLLIKNAEVFGFGKRDILIDNGIISQISQSVDANADEVFNADGLNILPGLVDVHVHFRQPGFEYKETIKSGSYAAARGGFTHVLTMPNLNPVPHNADNLKIQLDAIKKDAVINVIPYGAITVLQNGEALSDMENMQDMVAGFSDDGRGVQNKSLMKEAMEKAKKLNKVISAHCEDNSLLNGGYIHDGQYAKENRHKGICSESEWGPIKRDIALVKEVGCSYHVCHISAKESVEIIRQAKKQGIDITCETAPHYLCFSDKDIKDDGRYKMNPPIRGIDDKEALIQGVIDGTIDMIATDHAPHSEEEKSGGLKKSLNGIVGIETSFPVMYTNFVKTGIISLERLVEMMSINPAKRFKLNCEIKVGEKANFAVFDLNCEHTISKEEFLSKGKCSPFEGMRVNAKCIMTVAEGKIVWRS